MLRRAWDDLESREIIALKNRRRPPRLALAA
jgi:hypothetical protein